VQDVRCSFPAIQEIVSSFSHSKAETDYLEFAVNRNVWKFHC